MDISAISSGTTAATTAYSSTAKTEDAPLTPSATASTPATDTVTVSPAAQQALATSAATASTTTATTWSSDTVTKALTALNDETGSTTVSDKLSSYQLLAQMVSDNKNFDPSNPANAKAVDVATAFATSAFVNRYQQINAQYVSFYPNVGTMSADDLQGQLDYLKSLSSDDLQTLVGVNSANVVAGGKTPLTTSAAGFLAGIQARTDATRAMEATYASPTYAAALSGVADYDYYGRIAAVLKQAAATGDDATAALMQVVRSGASGGGDDAWTAKAEAYFDQYGGKPASTSSNQMASQPLPTSTYTPPSEGQVRALYQAMVSLNDSQQSPTHDQLDAYMMVLQQIGVRNLSRGVAVSLSVDAFCGSAVTKQVGSAYATYENKTFSGRGTTSTTSATSELNAFNSLSASDQDIIAYVRQSVGGDGTTDGYRQHLETSVSKSVELDARITAQMKNQSPGGKAAQVRSGVTTNTAENASSTSPSAGSQTTVAPQTDAEKALAILQAYTAGNAASTPKTDAEKALVTLKASTEAGLSAALTILKNASEVANKFADAGKYGDEGQAKATAADQPSGVTGSITQAKTASAQKVAGSSLSVTA